MRAVVGVTDNAWAAFLRDRSQINEANFWLPSAGSFRALSPGEPFLFKTKDPSKFGGIDIPGNSLVGGGFFDEYVELRVSEAWMLYGPGNGVAREADLLSAVLAYRARKDVVPDPDPTIGCIVLRNLFFAPRHQELSQPPRWSPSIVRFKGYDLSAPDSDADVAYVAHALTRLCVAPRVDLVWEPDLATVELDWDGARFGEPVLVRPRMGQGHFKRAVAAAYDHRCAVTGSRTFPSLEAAHIRPYASGGRHSVANGLLLRTDVHRLYDAGYLTIDPELRLRVSPQLERHGWNGREFYDREAAGFTIDAPGEPELRPDREALAWHQATVFRAA